MADKKASVSKKRQALGRGLSALISSSAVPVQPEPQSQTPAPGPKVVPGNQDQTPKEQAGGISYLPVSNLINNPDQPRQSFDEQELKELAESIQTLGVLQPVLVRPAEEEGKFEIIAGERRWRAAIKANLSQLPVIIKDLTDKEAVEISIVENVQRSNLSPMEEARAYQKLITDFGLAQREVAERVGKERATIANFVRLLNLPEEVQKMIEDGRLSHGHAKAILTVKEPAAQVNLARKVLRESLSVRALESIVSRVVVLKQKKSGKQKSAASVSETGQFPEVVDRLRKSLGTKVAIKHHESGRGRIEIEYFSEQELDRLVDRLC